MAFLLGTLLLGCKPPSNSLLGMHKDEIADAIASAEKVGTTVDYVGEPTSEQLDRDIQYYYIDRSKNREVSYGFNSKDILIEIRVLEISELFH